MSVKKKKSNRVNRTLFYCIVMLFACVSTGNAEGTLSLYWENDSELMKPNGNRDRHYSNGTKIVYFTQPGWQWLEDFSTWHFGDDSGKVQKGVGFFFGQNMYTPDYIGYPAARNEKDMKYAGWMYTGLFAQRATENLLDHIELNIGVIGPCAQGEDIQTAIHEITGGADPIGWDTQIANEPAVDLTFMRKQRLLEGIFKPTEHTDFIADYGFTLGSVNRLAQAGLMFRWGFNMGNSFGPGRLAVPDGLSRLQYPADKKQSGYVFARVNGKAVQYNRFMTGLDTEPLVGELQLGLMYRYNKLEICYSQTHGTKQFKEQTGSDSIGAVTVSWKF